MRDAVDIEDDGKPVVAAICTEFMIHGRNMTRFLGHPDLKILELPYPLEGRPEAELRAIAAESYPTFLQLIGAVENPS